MSVSEWDLTRSSAVVLCVVIGTLTAFDGHIAAQDSVRHHPSLIVLPRASHLRSTSDYDGVVRYELKVAHPATSVIEAITDVLRRQGWKPRPFSLSDPGIPTSHLDGWGEYVDQSNRLVQTWHGEWSISTGEHVEYTLSYQLSPDASGLFLPNDNLQVLGIYMSARTVAREHPLK